MLCTKWHGLRVAPNGAVLEISVSMSKRALIIGNKCMDYSAYTLERLVMVGMKSWSLAYGCYHSGIQTQHDRLLC